MYTIVLEDLLEFSSLSMTFLHLKLYFKISVENACGFFLKI